MEIQDIRTVAQRQHLRKVELVEIREGQRRVRIVIRSDAGRRDGGIEWPESESALHPDTPRLQDAITVKAESLGILRLSHPTRSLAPIKPGDTVVQGQPLALLEVRDVFSDIAAPCDGVVESVLVDEGDRIDYGKPLFTLKTSKP
jgi:acetyl-CoA carboxylase biotin carboxyl carrier protein